jgi:hypothetical protein
VEGYLRDRHEDRGRPLASWISKFIRIVFRLHNRLLLTTTITGFLSSILLAALTIAASKHFDRPPAVVWTQAYYFANYSAGGYFLVSCFMLFSMLETKQQQIKEEGYRTKMLFQQDSSVTQQRCHGPVEMRPYDTFWMVRGTTRNGVYPNGYIMCDKTVQDGHIKLHEALEYDYKFRAGPRNWHFTFETHHHWLMAYSVILL